ncbi:hypothetical protein H8L32_16615 [Undibacterium sp. CY18W]|uniref:Uncharacterized protein n=1 Tax=Undibacterium hunanense TaxID=2762292 RepID=A0ABR6ZTB8_9BURK|nr:hypothetical protein [Undibacterium hunanense]MBC3919116.1 hypothetical protein [Undibacterium hunanense]
MKFFKILFSIVLFFLGNSAFADDKANQSFSADPNIQKIAEAYSLDAVDYAKNQFGVRLDWTDASIEEVEKTLARMHSSYMETTPKPTEAQVMQFAKAFGSYLGEVSRRNHGAEWGIVNLFGQKFPGLKTSSGMLFWPWMKVSKRITLGSEEDVFFYYQAFLNK